ncbi:MAG: murein L,D-transpeptidase YcbB/YkuD [Hyphomicrobiaceae bacterium]|jgi:murein L,D-transpeptidase YcbB/YkuD
MHLLVLTAVALLALALPAAAADFSAQSLETRARAAIAEAERDVNENGRWPYIADGGELAVGAVDDRVASLRARLRATGELEGAPGDTEAERIFDAGTEAALLRFQQRHGLVESSKLDRTTLYHLDVPNSERIAQLRRNLTRLRSLRAVSDGRRVIVNIADFRVYLVEDDRFVTAKRVVAGTCFRQTPLISGEIDHVKLNPSWSVPSSIARNDKLPQLRADPGYAARNGFRVIRGWGPDAVEVDARSVDWRSIPRGQFPYRLEQRPGANNALGRIKISFKNSEDIYLHDTSAPELFPFAMRAFSSGCVRVQDPVELAAFVLNEPARDAPALSRAIAARHGNTYHARPMVPLDIVYWTAWVDADGKPQFRRDPYGRDPLPDDAPPTIPADCRVP